MQDSRSVVVPLQFGSDPFKILATRYDSIDEAELCCLELDERVRAEKNDCASRMLGLRLSWRVRVSSRGRGRRITFPRRVKQEHPPKKWWIRLNSLDRASCGAQQQRPVAYGDSDARSGDARGQSRLVRV
jgi:hypothetical protein